MTSLFVRSGTGSDANLGTSWGAAKATIGGATAIALAGDVIWVSDNHTESGAGSLTWDCAATAAGVRIIAVDDAADPNPPIALSASKVSIAKTGAATHTITGRAYINGFTISAGSSTSNAGIVLGTSVLPFMGTLENCALVIASTGVTSLFGLGPAASAANDNAMIEIIDCSFKFAGVTHKIQSRWGTIRMRGITLDAAGIAPTTLFTGIAGCQSTTEVRDSDLSGLAFTNLVDASIVGPHTFRFWNCKLPAGINIITGSAVAGGVTVELYNCDSGDTNYRYAYYDAFGSTVHETVVVRTNSYTDGAVNVALKMTGNSEVAHPHLALRSPAIEIWNETLGSAVTATLELLVDQATDLTAAEVWGTFEYLGTTGFPLGIVSSSRAPLVGAAAALAASTDAWTTTGLTNPRKHKLTATFTPREYGWIVCHVHLAAAKTIYIDPMLLLT